MGSRSGLCVKERWGGEVRRPAGRPGSLPPRRPQPPPLPRSRSAAAARAGRARGRLRHTLTHTLTHTRAHAPARLHLVLFPWQTHRRAGVLAASPQGSDPLSPAPGPALGKRRLLSGQLLRGLRRSHLGPTLGHCCYCRDVEEPRGARWRHANGNDTLLLLRARF